jgi:hypothetical protein
MYIEMYRISPPALKFLHIIVFNKFEINESLQKQRNKKRVSVGDTLFFAILFEIEPYTTTKNISI